MNLTNMFMFLLQGSAGAVSGYITNKYAVNMLFKEYTPFKLFNKVLIPVKFGGVIKNRKEEFIEEISDLVERDIINSRTILSNVENERFKDTLHNIIINFYNEELIHTFDGIKLNDIYRFEDIIINIFNEFMKVLESNDNVINNIIDKIDINDDLTKELINEISEGLYTGVENEISKNNLLCDSVKRLYDTVSHNNINEILCDNAIKLIESSLCESINSSLNRLFDDNEKINLLLENIYELCDIKDILDKIQSVFYAKKVGDYLSEDECNYISEKIYTTLYSYINSENGRNDLNKIIHFILDTIKDTDCTVYDLIPDDYKDTLSLLINKIIHKIVPYFSEWINKNKDDFDSIIEKSIDEAIINMDEGIKKIIISKVRELFLDNVAAKNEIVEKIISYLNNYNLDENSLNEISDIVLDYLKNTKISQIFIDVKDSNLIDHSAEDKILNFLKKQFEINGEKIISGLLKLQLEKNIGDIFNKDLYTIFDSKIKVLINYIVKNNIDSIKEFFNSHINSLILENIELIKNNRFDKYIDYSLIENNMDKINSFIVSQLNNNKSSIVQNINKAIHEKLEYMKADTSIRKKVIISAVDYMKSNIIKNSNVHISQIISENLCREEVYSYTSKAVTEALENNLDSLLRGKVKETVKHNLSQYNEEEICDLAQRFMGNELKPLSLFGGILGFIAGIIFGAFSRNIGLSGFYNNIYEQIISIILMGAVGIFTNVIAINMLFKPYSKNKVLAKIPFIKNFALGYIPAHKENISNSIGNVIDNELLSSSYIKNTLSKYRQKLKNNLLNTLESDNYKIISDFLIKSKNKIKDVVKKPAFILLTDNKNKIISSINSYIFNIRFKNNSIKQDLINELIESYEIEEKIKEVSAHYIDKFINGSLKVDDIIYPQLKDKIKNELKNSIAKSTVTLCDSIKEIDITDSSVCKKIYNMCSNNISPEVIENISVYCSKSSMSLIKNIVIENVNKVIDNSLYKDNTIETVFDGKVKIYIDKNLYSLTNFVVDKIKSVLISNEDYIKDSVKQKINSSLNFFEKIAYTMAGGEKIVDDAVTIMVEKNLPDFINERFFDVTNILKESLNKNIYKLKMEDVCPNINSNNINSLINSVFGALENNEQVLTTFSHITKNIINYSLSIINEDSIKMLLIKFREDINLALSESAKNIINNKSSINDFIYDITDNYVFSPICSIKIKSIFNDYSKEELLNDMSIFFDRIDLDQYLKNESFMLTNRYLNNKSIEDISDALKIKEYIAEKLSVLIDSDEFESAFEKISSELIENIIKNKIDIMDNKAKYQILNEVLEAALNCVINNSKEIIDSLELKEITRREIELMNPKEIHMLFLSFSGELFKKLYLYGVFGAIFGINLWIPIIAGLKEKINSDNYSKHKIEESKNTL